MFMFCLDELMFNVTSSCQCLGRVREDGKRHQRDVLDSRHNLPNTVRIDAQKVMATHALKACV